MRLVPHVREWQWTVEVVSEILWKKKCFTDVLPCRTFHVPKNQEEIVETMQYVSQERIHERVVEQTGFPYASNERDNHGGDSVRASGTHPRPCGEVASSAR